MRELLSLLHEQPNGLADLLRGARLLRFKLRETELRVEQQAVQLKLAQRKGELAERGLGALRFVPAGGSNGSGGRNVGGGEGGALRLQTTSFFWLAEDADTGEETVRRDEELDQLQAQGTAQGPAQGEDDQGQDGSLNAVDLDFCGAEGKEALMTQFDLRVEQGSDAKQLAKQLADRRKRASKKQKEQTSKDLASIQQLEEELLDAARSVWHSELQTFNKKLIEELELFLKVFGHGDTTKLSAVVNFADDLKFGLLPLPIPGFYVLVLRSPLLPQKLFVFLLFFKTAYGKHLGREDVDPQHLSNNADLFDVPIAVDLAFNLSVHKGPGGGTGSSSGLRAGRAGVRPAVEYAVVMNGRVSGRNFRERLVVLVFSDVRSPRM